MKSAERRKPKTEIKNIILSETDKCGNGPHIGTQEKSLSRRKARLLFCCQTNWGMVSRGRKYLQGVGCCRGVGSAKEQNVMKR